MATEAQLRVMAQHFIIAAIWADCEEGTHPRASKEAEKAALVLCTRFAKRAGSILDEAVACDGYGSHPDCGTEHPGYAAAGHDFYLTSRGHGVGFWDRKALEGYANDVTEQSLGDALTEVAKEFEQQTQPEFYRGWLYFPWYDYKQ